MVNIVELGKIDTRGGSEVRQTLNFGMPDARKPHLPNVRVGSTIGFCRERAVVVALWVCVRTRASELSTYPWRLG